jgi:hypothetical protein
MGFKLKDSEARTIPTRSSLVSDLKALKATSKSLLIFPNGEGRPNGHLLRDLKNVALRGKLNCGHCESEHFGKPVTARRTPLVSSSTFNPKKHNELPSVGTSSQKHRQFCAATLYCERI